MNFTIKFVDLNPLVTEQMSVQFEQYPNIEVINGFFEEVEDYDCMVSPANSFGIMDGGIDLAIRNYFGMSVQESVQEVILKKYFGEQPVGTSFIIPTGNEEHPFLAHTPTMRIPQPISGKTNVYYAMKALLSAVTTFNQEHNHAIQTVLCPGFGTLVGEMEPYDAVSQMELAYRHAVQPPKDINAMFAFMRNQEIETQKAKD